MIRSPAPTAVHRAKRTRRVAWAGLIAACWAITLGPIVHAVWHDRPHRHLSDGSIEMVDPVLAESLPHVHADGSLHGRLPEPAPTREDDSRPVERTPRGHDGGSSPAHFGVALVGAPAPPTPLGLAASCEIPGFELETAIASGLPRTSIQPRAPPLG